MTICSLRRRASALALGAPGMHAGRGPRPPRSPARVHPCLAAKAASPPSRNSGTTSPDPFESQPQTVASSKPSGARKTPESFLGPNAALVNLDSLVTRPAPPAQSLNPFLPPGAAAAATPGQPLPGEPAPAADAEPAAGEPGSGEQRVLRAQPRCGAHGLRDVHGFTPRLGGQRFLPDAPGPRHDEHGGRPGRPPVGSPGYWHHQPLPPLVPAWTRRRASVPRTPGRGPCLWNGVREWGVSAFRSSFF
ncbi:epsin-2 isoform X1 [Camelus ferus]|uniref:Epsin-2 isoform X1 n=1 Tax=Camelus ferus TaxID=419612 RepID=A0A8B8UKD4_CAMFR|nr:epsin-2 isoform X1 [Camelus ferus]